MNIKETVLYKTLCRQVRKEDHAELLRMLELVRDKYRDDGSDWDTKYLQCAFVWAWTPQGDAYWRELSNRMRDAGHPYY